MYTSDSHIYCLYFNELITRIICSMKLVNQLRSFLSEFAATSAISFGSLGLITF